VLRQKRDGDGNDITDLYKTWTEMLRYGRMIEDANKDDSDISTRAKARGQTKDFSLKITAQGTQSPVEEENSPVDPLIEPQIGIRRRKSGNLDLPAEVAELNSWIKAIEADHAQQASELEPFIRINKHLQTISGLPNDNDAIKRNIHKMLEHFDERSSFEMPELVQMMTTEVESEADKTGQFKWGFQLVVARNKVNFQLQIFMVTIALIWFCDPLSSLPFQYVASRFYWTFCASLAKPSPRFLIFSLRMISASLALKAWLSYYNCIIYLARLIAAPNAPWEAAMKSKNFTDSSGMQQRVFLFFITTIMSCSVRVSGLVGTLLERMLYVAWTTFFCSMVVSTLWFAKDWFKLHEDGSLHDYRLGAFLSVVIFICAMLSSLQGVHGN
jgi:hypothetical protein